VSAEEEVRLRFSLKETVYKAMHPLICQYVGFQEAEIQPLPDGSANVNLLLKSGAHERFGSVTAHWCRVGNFFLSTASVQLKEDVQIVGKHAGLCDLSLEHVQTSEP
jgi:4'-phosphopantetheinyl transferase EntD